MRVGTRLQNVSKFCDQAVDVTMYKYGWQKDTDLRQASIVKAESKLREACRPGLRCFFSVGVVLMLNLLFIGAFPACARVRVLCMPVAVTSSWLDRFTEWTGCFCRVLEI